MIRKKKSYQQDYLDDDDYCVVCGHRCCLVPHSIMVVTAGCGGPLFLFSFQIVLGRTNEAGIQMNTSSSSRSNILDINNREPGDVLQEVLLCVLMFCIVVLVVVTGIQLSLLSCCIVVLLSSCCSCCCYCRRWYAVIIVFFFVVVVRRSSSTCHRPPLLVAITVYCCFTLLRIVSHCCSCCSFPSDVQPFLHYSNILVSVLIKIWPHLDAPTGEYCCVRVGRNNDVPLWSTAQVEKKERG